tara:strand:+ start:12308 stop:12679 length:372 start_codon:yes stop_codon:yes gene_type:complete
MLDAITKELCEGNLIDFVQAKKEQTQAKIENGDRTFFGDKGEVKFQIHNKFYHYWGQRLGYQCWEDEQFVREFLRDNEICRVKSHSNKIQVGYGSLDKSSTFWKKPIMGTKFRKSYGSSDKQR